MEEHFDIGDTVSITTNDSEYFTDEFTKNFYEHNLIYKQLPDGVLRELKERTPKDESGHRKHRYHQLLTDDIGNPHLSNQITAVVTLMRASATWRNFERLFARAFGQQELDFEEQNE